MLYVMYWCLILTCFSLACCGFCVFKIITSKSYQLAEDTKKELEQMQVENKIDLCKIVENHIEVIAYNTKFIQSENFLTEVIERINNTQVKSK